MSNGEQVGLETTFQQRADRGLNVQVLYQNNSGEVVYVFDRQWTLNQANQFQPDNIGAYRFLDDADTLVLLVGPAPLPRSMSVLYENVPHATRLDPGQRRELRLSIVGPIAEETAYFPVLPNSTFTPVEVRHVELVLSYLPASSEALFRASALFSDGFELVTPAPGGAASDSVHWKGRGVRSC